MINLSWSSLVEKSQQAQSNISPASLVIYPLVDRCIIEVSGEGAEKLLQGQITCDVAQLSDSRGTFGASCTPQGRMYALFKMAKTKQGYLLSMPTVIADGFIERIEKYRAFFKAEIQQKHDWIVFGLSVKDAPQALLRGYNLPESANQLSQTDNTISYRLPAKSACWEIWAEKDSWLNDDANSVNDIDPVVGSQRHWYSKLAENGIPELQPETIEKFTPHMLNLPQLGGVSFKKGCYTGQEIIARTEYRGTLKKHVVVYTADLTSPITPDSSLLNEEGHSIGTVINHYETPDGSVGLALISKELDTDIPHNLSVRSGNEEAGNTCSVRLRIPNYLATTS